MVKLTSNAAAMLLNFKVFGPTSVSVYRSMVDNVVNNRVRNVRNSEPMDNVHATLITIRVKYFMVTYTCGTCCVWTLLMSMVTL